jgi:hypothetical protein
MKSRRDNRPAAIRDLLPPLPPPGVLTVPWNRGYREQFKGDELSYWRGHHVGIHDAYKFLVKIHPRVAYKLLKHFGMNKDGSYGGVGG